MKGIFIPIKGNEAEKYTKLLEQSNISYTVVGECTTRVKTLPRLPNGQINPVFMANGNTYTILSIEQGVGIERYTQLTKFLIPFWSGRRSFKEIQQYWLDAINECYQTKDHKDAKHLFMNKAKGFIDSLSDISEARHDLAMYICAILIVKEGEDLRYYNMNEAEAKIDDWIKEGYSPHDFFGIASGLSREFREEYEARETSLEKQLRLRESLGFMS